MLEENNINRSNIAEVTTVKMGFVNSYILSGNIDSKGRIPLILVDSGISGSENKIIRELKKIGANPQDVSLIIITHAHRDHTGSVKKLKSLTGAKIAIHKNDAEFLEKGASAKVKPITGFAKSISKLAKFTSNANESGVIPDIIFENELDLKSFGINGKAIATPGHTEGSISILLESGNCIIGDMLGKSFGKVATGMFCSDIEENKKSIRKVIDSGAKLLYLSHGGTSTASQVSDVFPA